MESKVENLVNGKTNFGQQAETNNVKYATNYNFIKSSNLLPAISPQGKGYIIWLMIVTLCYHYNAWCIPLRESFLKHHEHDMRMYWMVSDCLSDFIYLIDLVLVKPRVMFLQEGLWVTDISVTSTNYWKKSQYKLDYMSALPLDVLYSYYGSETTLLRLPRLLKFQTVQEFYSTIDSLTSYPYAFRVGKSLFYFFLFIHLNACAFYKTDAVENPAKDINPYLFYFYNAAAVVATYGKYHPRCDYTFTTALSCSLSFIVSAILVGQICKIYETANKAQMEHRDRVRRCVQYLKNLNMSKLMIYRVTDWFAYMWQQQHNFDESRILNFLPYNIKQDVALAVHMSTLSKIEIFRDCSESLLRDLMLQLRPVSFLPGDVVVRRGDVGHHMYIVKSGECCVMTQDGREVLATLREGSVFGEISLLGISGASRRTATVRSRGYSSLFALSKKNLDSVLSYNREAALVMRRNADRMIRVNVARAAEDNLLKLENQKRLRKIAEKNENNATSHRSKLPRNRMNRLVT